MDRATAEMLADDIYWATDDVPSAEAIRVMADFIEELGWAVANGTFVDGCWMERWSRNG